MREAVLPESNVNSRVTSVEAALNFDLETDPSERLSLSSLRGKTVNLYFYPIQNVRGLAPTSKSRDNDPPNVNPANRAR